MALLHRIFGSLKPSYLIRAYVIGGAIFAIYATFSVQSATESSPAFWIYCAVSTILFPFSKLVWDEIMSMMMGGAIFMVNALIMIFLKVVINVLLWASAILVAPFGVLFLWFRTRTT